MKKLVFLSLLSVALLTSCGNGAQKDALKAQNDSLMVELSNRNAELDDIMGAFNEVQEGFRQINEAENRVDLQSGSIRENSADKIKEDIRFISEKLQSNREQIAELVKDKTLVVIAHKLPAIMNADQICVVDHGKLVAAGKHQDLIQSCPEYQKLWKAAQDSAEWNIHTAKEGN